jgi:putative CocE/NonD family hydrolase
MATTRPGTQDETMPGRVSRTVDRVFDRILGLDPAPGHYTVDVDVPVTMGDGTVLVADHYRPTSPTTHGTILVRTPYGRGFPGDMLYARPWAARGYHVLFQSCRGSSGSGGDFEPFVHEGADARATVEWLRGQDWFDGRLATIGGSYLGWSQWALMADPPPELRAAVIVVATHDMAECAYGSGSFTLNDLLGWAYLVADQETRGPLGGDLLRSITIGRALRPVMTAAPLGEAAAELLQGRTPWFLEWLGRPDISEPFWDGMKLGHVLATTRVPTLLMGGWQDVFVRHTIQQYEALHARGVETSLLVGPWSHLNFVSRAGRTVTRRTSLWLDRHLAGREPGAAGAPGTAPPPVHVHVTGGGGWRELPEWPPPTREEVWFVGPRQWLGTEPPAADDPPSRFRYDPADPTPAYAGRRLSADAGVRDNKHLEARPDVVTFTGPQLAADLEVVGSPVVELVHSTDNPYADVFVRLCDVDRRGTSRNFSDGFVRLDPARPAGTPVTVRIQLDPCAHRLQAGHRLRLQVSGGAHPRFARNPGTPEPLATAVELVPSNHEVHHGAGGRSRVLLPVSPTQPG